MEFETVKRCGRTYVVKNGVESAWFTQCCGGGRWRIVQPILYDIGTLDEALKRIAITMGNWHTATQAAEVLVEMGVFDEPPSPQRMTKWCRDGLLPGAIKVRALRGSGGAWRIPASALPIFAERRKQ